MFHNPIPRATLVALALVGITALSSEASQPKTRRHATHRSHFPWSQTAGYPEHNPTNDAAIHVWRHGRTVHILSANNSRDGDRIRGTVVVKDGGISLPRRIKTEGKDGIAQMNRNRLAFDFTTWGGNDGVAFDLVGGQTLVLTIHQERGEHRPILVGKENHRAQGPVVTFHLRR